MIFLLHWSLSGSFAGSSSSPWILSIWSVIRCSLWTSSLLKLTLSVISSNLTALNTIYTLTPIFTSPASHIYISPLNSRISNCSPNISTEITIRHSKFICPQLKSSGKPQLPIGFSISPIYKDLEIDSVVSSSHILCPIYQQILLVLPSRKYRIWTSVKIPSAGTLVQGTCTSHLSYCSHFIINLFLPLLTLFLNTRHYHTSKSSKGFHLRVEAKVHQRPKQSAAPPSPISPLNTLPFSVCLSPCWLPCHSRSPLTCSYPKGLCFCCSLCLDSLLTLPTWFTSILPRLCSRAMLMNSSLLFKIPTSLSLP